MLHALIDLMIESAEDVPEDLGAVLRAVPPPDGADAETFDRYGWQAMMALIALRKRRPSGRSPSRSCRRRGETVHEGARHPEGRSRTQTRANR